MKKLSYLLSLIFMLSCFSFSQTTTVTATVQYPDGQVFANGTVSAVFTPVPGGIGQSGYLLNGAPFPYQVSGVMDATGTFVVVLTDDTAVRPLGGKWNFTMCSQASVPCSTSLQDVSGSTLNLSTRLSADVRSIFSSPLDVPRFFQDSEVGTNSTGGQIYYNLPAMLMRCWTGSSWAYCGGGGTSSSDSSLPLLNLGVVWANDFYAIETNIVNVKTDTRVTPKAAGNGTTDDTAAIRAAIVVASGGAGGTVYFPTGTYKIIVPSDTTTPSPLVIPANVILRGTSRTLSTIQVNNPGAALETDNVATWGGIKFRSTSHIGFSDLTFAVVGNASAAFPCAALWNRGSSGLTDVFFNNVNIQLGNCRSLWVEGVNQLLLLNSLVDSTESNTNTSQLGPVFFSGDNNFTMKGNTITYNFGRVHANNNTNSVIEDNTFARDALNKSVEGGTALESGGLEISFNDIVSVQRNIFTTANFQTIEVADGEALTSQQATAGDVVDAGSMTAVDTLTLTDSAALWGATTTTRLGFSPRTVVVITSGPATGEIRTVASINTGTKVLTVTQPWSPVPSVGALYAMFTWTLSNATIKNNTFTSNPNGLQIYSGCYNCLIQNNTLLNSRQISLRQSDTAPSYSESRRAHFVTVNSSVLNNIVTNTNGVGPSYIALDEEGFVGDTYTAMNAFNVAIGDNIVSPWPTTPSKVYSPGAFELTQEGYFPCFIFGPGGNPPITTLQNVYFWNDIQTLPVTYVAPNDPTTACAGLTLPSAQFASLGWLDVGTSTPPDTAITVFANLPACSAQLEGSRRPISDSTTLVFNATITGGSTGHVQAYCNGTNWTVH